METGDDISAMTANEFVIDISMSLNYQFDLITRQYGTEGLSIGMRMGAIIAPIAYALSETYWNIGDGKRKVGPDSGFFGGHAMITFGFGGAQSTESWP
jgi:hypothetical protein